MRRLGGLGILDRLGILGGLGILILGGLGICCRGNGGLGSWCGKKSALLFIVFYESDGIM